MSIANMKSREAVLEAVKEFDQLTRPEFLKKYGFGRAKEYFLDHNGNLYDSKAIVGAAHGYEFPDQGPLTSRDFAGGDATVKPKLEGMGFTVRVPYTGPEPPQNEADEAIEATISLERDIEGFLASNLSQLEPGLRLYSANGKTGRQFDAKAAGRIDLLAEDAENGLVVIEVKVGEVDREVCGQIQAYMGWVQNELPRSRNVRGIIVASGFTERLKLATKVVPGLSLKRYCVSFAFKDA
jgi:hypothetical protein